MSRDLFEQTHFGDLEGLIEVLTDEHRMAVLYGDNSGAYVEFTTPKLDTCYRFWWNEKLAEKGAWQAEKRAKVD